EGALPVAAAAQPLQGHRHCCVEGLAAPAPGHWTPDLAHVIPVDHEDQAADQTLSSPVLVIFLADPRWAVNWPLPTERAAELPFTLAWPHSQTWRSLPSSACSIWRWRDRGSRGS